MKKALLLIILTGIISCTDYNEDLSYADHISQIDSIVSANNDMKELELLLSCRDTKPVTMMSGEWWL